MSIRLPIVALIATLAVVTPASAQRVAELRPVGVVQLRPSATPAPLIPTVAAPSKRHHLWPWFMLGGAVAGASTVVVMGVRNCDINCRDDGGWAQAPYFAAIAAGIGAVAGGVLGLIVDSSRGDAAAAPSSGQ